MRNIAVVGCGYWGKNLVRNFYELGVLAAICDPIDTIAKKFSEQYNVPSKSWEELLNDEAIHGVVLAVPAVLHTKLCCEAIKAKKDVYVEKPLSLTEKEGFQIKDALENSSQILLVGHLLQYHPAVVKIKELLKSDVLGNLKYIRSHRFNMGKIRHEENVLWSFAPHDFSVVHSIANSPIKTIQSHGQYLFNDDIADRVDVTIEFESGIHAEVCVSWVHPFKEQKLVIGGTKGMLVFDDTLPLEQKLKFYKHNYSRNGKTIVTEKIEPELISLDPVEPLKAECQHFVDCIQNRQQPYTNIDEGIAVVHMLQLAQEKLNKQKIL
jgi:UDP-2-acetamido-3-amino-2,3-dideoxy-glucuronate N-acetyltransferase